MDCSRNIIRKTVLLPTTSENHAHRRRPDPLAIEIRPTRPAAVAAVACEISCAMGEAWEMIAIPAVEFKNRVIHSAYHCQLPRSSVRVKFCVEELCWLTAID